MIYLIFKRLTDIFFSIIGLILFIPLTIIIKICYISTGDFNSIFFKQKRIGKNGKHFYIYKYRSMVYNADQLLKKILKNKEIRNEYYKSFKIKNDPRITKIGNFLRKTSIDEIPQFINILKGNMSLVGPRPIVDKEIIKYGKAKDILLSVKPGLTGLWAVNGRNNLSYEERVKLEIFYVKNKSILLDTKIIIKSFWCVIKKTGAI